jgi:hypothetical protein
MVETQSNLVEPTTVFPALHAMDIALRTRPIGRALLWGLRTVRLLRQGTEVWSAT